MELFFRRSIKQVLFGKKYKGTITIQDEHKLNFTIDFTKPIWELESMVKEENYPTNIRSLRKLFKIVISREDETVVEISNEEFRFFMMMVVDFAVEFYRQHLKCNPNLGVIRTMASFVVIIFEILFGTESSCKIEMNQKVCMMLEKKIGKKFVNLHA